MTFGERVFLYCERGGSEALFAEPINAVSNAAFLLAALAGFLLVLRRPPEERNADQFLLPVLVLFIGLGSLAFHLYADRGSPAVALWLIDPSGPSAPVGRSNLSGVPLEVWQSEFGPIEALRYQKPIVLGSVESSGWPVEPP